jgi:hypothetical protein
VQGESKNKTSKEEQSAKRASRRTTEKISGQDDDDQVNNDEYDRHLTMVRVNTCRIGEIDHREHEEKIINTTTRKFIITSSRR